MEWRAFGNNEVVEDERLAFASLRADVGGRVEALTVLGEQLSAASGRRVALLILREETPPPDPALRKQAAGILGRILEHGRAVAVVVEGGGIAATTKRTMVRVVATVVRARAAFRVFGTINEARDWLFAETGEAALVGEFAEALAKLSGPDESVKTA